MGFLVSFVACDKKTDSKKSSGEESYDAELQLLKNLESKTDTATLTETKKEEPKVDLNSFDAHKNKHDNYRFSYSASSYLVETLSSGTTSYSPDNLATKIGTPWVPKNLNGKNGIGETVTLKGAWDNHLCLAVRNGFQSESKPNLYKDNSRAKTISVTCTESQRAGEFDLMDSMEDQIINLQGLIPEQDSGSVTLTIKIISVYGGSRYKDICIDSIVPYFGEYDEGTYLHGIEEKDPLEDEQSTLFFDIANSILTEGSVSSREAAFNKWNGAKAKFKCQASEISSDGGTVKILLPLFDGVTNTATAYFQSKEDREYFRNLDITDGYFGPKFEFTGTLTIKKSEFLGIENYEFNFSNCKRVKFNKLSKTGDPYDYYLGDGVTLGDVFKNLPKNVYLAREEKVEDEEMNLIVLGIANREGTEMGMYSFCLLDDEENELSSAIPVYVMHRGSDAINDEVDFSSSDLMSEQMRCRISLAMSLTYLGIRIEPNN